MTVTTLLESCLRDIRYGLRQLRQSPGFTTVAVLSLALGIGANTAIFQLVDAVRLRSLPVKDPGQLVYVDFEKESYRAGWWSSRSARLTSSVFEQLHSQQQAFSSFFAWSITGFNLASGGEARPAQGLWVSGDFFSGLGVTPMLGRLITPEDDQPGCGNPGVVLSHAFWQREYAGDPAAIGRTVSLDGRPFPILGVAPPSFFGVEVGRRFDVAAPLCGDALLSEPGHIRATMKHAWWLSAMGRLKPGWSLQRANAHIQAISPGLMQAALPLSYRSDQAKKFLANKLEATAGDTGVSGLRRNYETPLWLLLATTGLVLLIACANLANLLLARASIREREVAIRQAIGASRGRLIRQLLAESLLLSLFGAGLGALLAQVFSRALVAFISTPGSPLFVGLGVDWRVLGFTGLLAVTTCLLFGLAPAWRATRIAPGAAMKASGRGLTASRERFGLRRALVVAQVSMSLVLLVGALLFVRSLHNLLMTDPGFHSEGLVAASLDGRRANVPTERRAEVFRQIEELIASRPGIAGVAQVAITPISGSGWDGNIVIPGAASTGEKESWFNRVSPGYFKLMGTTFVAGRDFEKTDVLNGPKVAIVNEEFARSFFAGKNPVGQIFRQKQDAGEPDQVYQIVGLVKNTKYGDLRETTRAITYLPTAQDSKPGTGAEYIVRARGGVGDALSAIKSAVAEANPMIDIQFNIMDELIEQSLLRERLMATLSGAFGLLAGLLATLGLYGVMAYSVARRRNEIGVRIALGADRTRVLALILGEAGRLLIVGLVVGSALAVWAGQAAAALLYGLKPHDPLTLTLALALLSVVALAASFVPAHRAAGVDPATALREE